MCTPGAHPYVVLVPLCFLFIRYLGIDSRYRGGLMSSSDNAEYDTDMYLVIELDNCPCRRVGALRSQSAPAKCYVVHRFFIYRLWICTYLSRPCWYEPSLNRLYVVSKRSMSLVVTIVSTLKNCHRTNLIFFVVFFAYSSLWYVGYALPLAHFSREIHQHLESVCPITWLPIPSSRWFLVATAVGSLAYGPPHIGFCWNWNLNFTIQLHSQRLGIISFYNKHSCMFKKKPCVFFRCFVVSHCFLSKGHCECYRLPRFARRWGDRRLSDPLPPKFSQRLQPQVSSLVLKPVQAYSQVHHRTDRVILWLMSYIINTGLITMWVFDCFLSYGVGFRVSRILLCQDCFPLRHGYGELITEYKNNILIEIFLVYRGWREFHLPWP